MLKIIARILLGILSVLVIVVVGVLIFGPGWARKTAEKSFPKIEGEIVLDSLDGQVDVYRDSMGIPHIYATTEHDLFLVQGYVHAQDRFWQMDFWRHQGAGRLSELLGSNLLETDKFLRTLGWERVAKEEIALIDDDARFILESYSEGVNAYLADHIGSTLALEFAFLPILNREYQPKPWTPLNTMTWAKAMAWDLRGNMDTEIARARLLKDLSSEQVNFLYPPYPDDRPVIVTKPHITKAVDNSGVNVSELMTAVNPALIEIAALSDGVDAVSGGGFEGIGSNSWVLSGNLTNTGTPLLANDPHLGVQLPSIWYQIGLHCVEIGSSCRVDVTGFSFPGAPGVIIGHNARIAWGLTNLGPDVMDLYIEKINPENPNQYEYKGDWVDMVTIVEEIQVSGGDVVEQVVRLTRHGPIITDVYGLSEFADEAGIDLPSNFAVSVRWTALEPSCVFCAAWNINKAQDWEEFRAGASQFVVPSQNLVFADVDGNIGYQAPGYIPIRSENHDGILPVPGWTGEYEWQGYIPFEDLPFAFNPTEGFIVTANNAVIGTEYPYYISDQWAYGQRAQVIVDMIQDSPGAVSVDDIQQMQGDNRALIAEDLLPYLMEISLEDDTLEDARSIFEGWDYQMDIDSNSGALFGVFWSNLLSHTFEDDLPEFYSPDGGGRWMEIVRILLAEPTSAWWDDSTTEDIETRDEIIRLSFEGAVKEIQKMEGKNPSEWQWGDFHTITFENQVMSSFPIIKNIFNRGPFQTAGGKAIVNATGWSSVGEYQVVTVPSMRMIVDLGNFNNSLTMHTTGQSGHPNHTHYIDMADPWRFINYHPMNWEFNDLVSKAEGHLVLVP